MKRIGQRSISILLALVMCFSILPVNIFAWKNLTHVNSADIILMELERAANGHNQKRASVKIYTNYDDKSEGKYTYTIPEEFQQALFTYPDAFRAGSLGPDFYPDIIVGQMYTHPYDQKAKVGSGEWVEMLCQSVNSLPEGSPQRLEALSFTLGYMLHFCGDP